MTLGDLRILIDEVPRALDGCQVMLGVGDYFSEQVVVQPLTEDDTTIVFITSVENTPELPYWEPVEAEGLR